MLRLLIQNIGAVNLNLLEWLKENIKSYLPSPHLIFEVSQKPIQISPSLYDSNRSQFKASGILREISSLSKESGFFRILGVTEYDIYVEGLNFVFGLAQKPLNLFDKTPLAALISTNRLKTGLPKSDIQFFKLRLLKEAIHELGHTFSLDHCSNNCVMKFSNTIFETDLKPPSLCERCVKQAQIFISNMNG